MRISHMHMRRNGVRGAQKPSLARLLCAETLASSGGMTNLLPAGFVLIPNKAAVLRISEDVEPSLFLANAATVRGKDIYSAGVLGQYFVFGDSLTVLTGKPLVASFAAADPVAVLAYKLSNGNTYLWGITVPKLIEWAGKPPARSETVAETAMFGCFKLPNASVTGLALLENTETHPLKDYADLLISFTPTFKAVGVRSIKENEKYAANGFTKVRLYLGQG